MGIFQIHPRAPPPAGGLKKFIFVADKKIKKGNSGRTIPTLTILLHIFLDLSSEIGNEDALIQDYFGFSYALHLLPEVFWNSFVLRTFLNFKEVIFEEQYPL